MGKRKEYIGQKFGLLTVVKELENRISSSGRKSRNFLCKCDCGGEVERTSSYLCNKRITSSCGCLDTRFINKDLIGAVFGKLTVVKELEPKVYSGYYKNRQFQCFCECGSIVVRGYNSLHDKRSIISSCGCAIDQSAKSTIHGFTGTPTHISWSAMKQRCLNTNDPNYYKYGGRGITIEDDRWFEFENFLTDMGERPEGKTLDRIDNSKGYCADNCRWATSEQQAHNSRVTKLTKADVYRIRLMRSEGLTYKDIASKFNVNSGTIGHICRGETWKNII